MSTLPPQIPTSFALRAGRFSFAHHNLENFSHRDQFIRVFDRRYLGLEARGGGQVFFESKTDVSSDRFFPHFDHVAYQDFLLQVFRHCPTDLRDSDSFKAYITCAVFSGDGQEVKICSSFRSAFVKASFQYSMWRILIRCWAATMMKISTCSALMIQKDQTTPTDTRYCHTLP